MVSTTIEVSDNPTNTITESICVGDSIALGNSFYFTTGIFSDTIINGAGCESITTLDLTVENQPYNLENFSPICAGAEPLMLSTLQDGINGTWEGTGVVSNSFNPDGLSGNIILTFIPDENACADIATTTIEVAENTLSNMEATICEGEILSINNIDYSTAGTFTQTLFGVADECDTLLTLVLNVEIIDNLPAADAGMDQEICGDETDLSAVTSNGITGVWEIITGQPLIADLNNPVTSISDLQAEETQLSWVVSSEFCPDYDRDSISISVIMEEPFAVADSILVTSTDPVQFNLTANDDLPTDVVVSIINEPIEGTLENLGNGLFEFTPSVDFETGQMIFGYEVCNVNCPDLCSDAAIIINLEKDNRPIVEVPSGITPNGDDKNEQLVIPAIRDNPELFENAELVVFSRWGDIIFQAQPYNNDWGGTGPTGDIVPQGTYYYVLRLNLGQGIVYRGDITVLR